MKTISSSIPYQDEGGNALTKGSLILSLPVGVYLIAAGGGQVVGTSIIVNFDAAGKIPAGVQIWASDELNPQTPYSATICSGQNGVGPLASATWLIAGASPIDLSQLTPVTNNEPSFLAPVVLNPTAAQTITGQPLILAGSTPLTANGAVTTNGTLTANGALIANSTAGVAGATSLSGGGSLSGTFTGNPTLSGNPAFTGNPTFSLIQSASSNRSATGVLRLASTDFLAWRNNANSADVTLSKNASDQFLLGSTVVPNSSDTAVLRSTTDTLTNKTLTSPTLTTPNIGGETVSSAPRMTWGIDFIANGNTNSGAYKQWTLDKAITVTRVEVVYAGTSGSGSVVPAKLRVTDGTTNTDVNQNNGATSDTSGAISVNYAAGAVLQIKTVAGVGYTTNPTNLTVTVQYKMQ